jgi:hypothetical protein
LARVTVDTTVSPRTSPFRAPIALVLKSRHTADRGVKPTDQWLTVVVVTMGVGVVMIVDVDVPLIAAFSA